MNRREGCIVLSLAAMVAVVIIALLLLVYVGNNTAPLPPIRADAPRVTADDWYGGTGHGGPHPDDWWDNYPFCMAPPCPTLTLGPE